MGEIVFAFHFLISSMLQFTIVYYNQIFMCYFASAGMLGKRLNSPLLTIDSAAQFCYCKVNAFYNIFLFFFLASFMCMFARKRLVKFIWDDG